MSDKKFTPDWTNTPPVPGSYRSIVKEGRQDQVKVPTREYYEQIKRDLKLDDNYFTNKHDGNQPLRDIPKSNLDTKIIEEIIRIVGAENVQCDDYNRVKYSYGKLAEETSLLASPTRTAGGTPTSSTSSLRAFTARDSIAAS